MTRVFLGIGSNTGDAALQLARAIELLARRFNLQHSRAVRSAAEGFDGAPFVNVVVCFDTDLTLKDIVGLARCIEIELGKDLTQARFADKAIDLDVLYFGDLTLCNDRFELPARDVLHPYYLCGLYELQPDWIDPRHSKTVAELWAERDCDLAPVALPSVPDLRETRMVIDDFRLSLHLGVTEEERAQLQEVSLTIAIRFEMAPGATHSDCVNETLNYSTLARMLTSEFTGATVRTIEHLAGQCTDAIARTTHARGTLTVGVRKFPQTPGIAGGASFELTTDMY